LKSLARDGKLIEPVNIDDLATVEQVKEARRTMISQYFNQVKDALAPVQSNFAVEGGNYWGNFLPPGSGQESRYVFPDYLTGSASPPYLPAGNASSLGLLGSLGSLGSFTPIGY
jgi:hypothetical protein